MKCPECGGENRAGARFCARCGKPLAEPTAPVESATASVAPEVVATEAVAPETVAPPEPTAEEAKPETAPQPAEPLIALPAPPERRLAPGDKLLDRYEIIELLSEDENGALYAAYDLLRCARCGYAGNEKGGEYCGQCGAALDQKARCLIRQKPLGGEALIADQFSEGDFVYTVTLGQESQPQQPSVAPSVSLRWGKKTDVGAKRDLNEDSLDVRVYSAASGATLGLFVVADGVGGQEHGEVASKLAIETIWAQVRDKLWKPEMTGEVVTAQMMENIAVEAAKEANQAIYKLRRERRNDMGATLTMALVRDTLAIIANVGDSRTYLWGVEGLKRVSVDHSVVESLVASGEITREQAYTHPQRNLIYRSLGDRPAVDVDTFVQPLRAGDRLILCSDGLWEMAHDEGIEEILMREADPQAACDVLVERANLAGGDDNITVIIVQIESLG